MGQSAIRHCPICNKPMAFLLPPGGGPRTFQCLRCDREDPLQSDYVKGWLHGELAQPAQFGVGFVISQEAT